jgi:voltage-gated potassium channel
MTRKRYHELSPAAQKRVVTAALLRAGGLAAVLVVVYYLIPLDRPLDAGTWIEFTLGLVIFAVILGLHTRAIIASDVPRLRAIETVATGLPTLLLLFAAAYFLIARNDPSSFSEMLNRTDALYFTVTVLSTVGFGDIAPHSDVARILAMVQMLMDLVAFGLIAKILVEAVQVAQKRRESEGSDAEEIDGDGG